MFQNQSVHELGLRKKRKNLVSNAEYLFVTQNVVDVTRYANWEVLQQENCLRIVKELSKNCQRIVKRLSKDCLDIRQHC